MKTLFRFLFPVTAILAISPVLYGQSGYGGDGKTSGDSSVASYIRLYETAPGAATTALAGAGAGSVDNGAHLVKVTCYTPGGQTTGGTASNSTTVADKTTNGKIAISAIPTCSSIATGRKVYMTTAGTTNYFLLSNGTIADNTTTTLTANDSDATLSASTALPTSNTALDTRATIGQTYAAFQQSLTIVGNIGIGTASPTKAVSLSKTGSGSAGEPVIQMTGSAAGAQLEIGLGNGTAYTSGDFIIYQSGLGGTPIRIHLDAANDNAFIMRAGNIGFGTTPGASIPAKLTARSTTESMRLEYDASNYVKFVVSSTGKVTATPTGTSPTFALATSLEVKNATVTASAGATLSLDLSTGNIRTVTFGAGNITSLTATSVPVGWVTIMLIQDGVGSRTASWDTAVFKAASATFPTLSTGAGKKDVLFFQCDGTLCYLQSSALDVR